MGSMTAAPQSGGALLSRPVWCDGLRAPDSWPCFQNCSVLVAEDEAVQALDLAITLNDFGCTVLGPASSVAEAASLLDKARPNLALLDVRLRDGDVEPLAESLTAVGIPFALVTGYGSDIPSAHPLLSQVPRLGKPYSVLTLGEQVWRLFQTDLEQRLAQAELQITQAEKLIARQAKLIQRLARQNQDTSLAERLLREMERSLELMWAHWQHMLRETLREQTDLL
jgi:DNA-binding NtrC family response regulator